MSLILFGLRSTSDKISTDKDVQNALRMQVPALFLPKAENLKNEQSESAYPHTEERSYHMKRQIANLSTFVVIFAVFMFLGVQGVVYGQIVSIDPASVESPVAGEQLIVNINITGGMNVAGYQVTVTFDSTALSYVSIANGDYLPAGAFATAPVVTDTSATIGAAGLPTASGVPTADGDGTLATATFSIVEAKDSVIELTNVLVSDATATAQDVTIQGGMVTVPTPEISEEPETLTEPATPLEPATPTEPEMSAEPVDFEVGYKFEMALASGLNMISLPLMPAEPYTASSFAEMIGATVVIRLDTAKQEFVGFTADQEGDGFAIEGSQGYIVNVPDGGTVTFTGTAWNNAAEEDAAAAPGVQLPSTGWAFVVSGDLLKVEAGVSYTVVATNHRTGEIATRQLSSDHKEFNAVWADLSRQSVIEAGDTLEVTLIDQWDNIVSGPFTHRVGIEDLRKAYLSLPLTVGDVHPAATILGQNFPNPFNPETWIPYQLEKSSDVALQIYDMSGSIVRTIDLGFKSRGFYMTRSTAAYWDGRNNMGEQVASGVYFYSLQTTDFSATRKMLILK